MRPKNWKISALLLSAVICGCGGMIEKPGESPGGTIPFEGTYTHYASYSGFEGANWLSMSNGHIYLTFESPGLLRSYYSNSKPRPVEFADVGTPSIVGAGAQIVAVADATTLTIRLYSISGGSPLTEFSDPDWRTIGGIAVDDSGNVYVADTEACFIRSYDRSGERRFEVDLADSGFGIGHVVQPRGICIFGEALYIAEAGPDKNQVQKISIHKPQQGIPFSDGVPYISSFTYEDGEEVVLLKPVDVAVDDEGNIFVLDEALKMIFKYDPEGYPLVQVNGMTDDPSDTLSLPVSIATYRNRVYGLDKNAGVIHRWQLQR